MVRLGHARVSLGDQNADLQILELEAAGCQRIYKDQGISGTRVSRPELDRLLDRLGPGHEVVVWKLDSLGRSTRHLLELLDDFKIRGVKLRSLRDGIATARPAKLGKRWHKPWSPSSLRVSQLERDQLSERAKAGMAAAAANGQL